MYIAFEWIVWTWKSTQSKRLAEKLQQHYPDREVVHVREPGSTEISEKIRSVVQWEDFNHFTEEMDADTEAYLYSAARAQLLNTLVLPTLQRWGIVISDRTFITSLAYQWHAMTWDVEHIWNINKPIVEQRIPDLVLVFSMDIEEALARTFDGDWDKHELKTIEFFNKAQEGFINNSQDSRFAKHSEIIDAQGTIEQVEERVRKAVMDHK